MSSDPSSFLGRRAKATPTPSSMACPDIEREYLTACVQNRRNFETTMHLIGPEDFTVKEHGMLFAAMREVFGKTDAGKPAPFDTGLIDAWLRQRGAKLSSVATEAFYGPVLGALGSEPIEDAQPLCEEITKASRMRRLYAKTVENLKAMEESPHEEDLACSRLLDLCGATIAEKASRDTLGGGIPVPVELDTIGPEVVAEIHARMEAKKAGRQFSVTFGISAIDGVIGGLYPGELSIIAGRPSLGKSLSALHLFERSHELGLPSAFFQLELDRKQVYYRMVSQHCGIPFMRLSKGDNFSQQELKDLETARARMAGQGRIVLCKPGLSADEICAHTKILKAKHLNLSTIFVDGLWLIRHHREKGDSEASGIADSVLKLRNLALGLGIHVCLVHQLNRDNETRATSGDAAKGKGAPPRNSDLKGSGACEENAALIMLLDRPMYGDEGKGAPKPVEELTIIVSKNRRGTPHRGVHIMVNLELQYLFSKDLR